MRKFLLPLALLSLAACGETVGEQVVAGGAVGAGAAAVTGGDMGRAAAVGAAGNLVFCQANPDRC